jgi:Zn-finger nucleic acid-binding protein
MQCPDCNNELQAAKLKDISIHRCSKCAGVWMHHTELEKIKEFVSEVKGFLEELKILKIKIAVQHPHLAQSWENIESISPFK